MLATLALGALLSLGAHPDPCAKSLPRGPHVPAPIVLSTDCGWYSLDTDGDVSRLPADWYATHHEPWHPAYGLTYRRTRSGRYIVVRNRHGVWRSAGLYFSEDGSGTFGPHAFAFASWGQRGIFLTDLRGPERLVLRGRAFFPMGFTAQGELLVSGRRSIIVLSPAGTVVRWLRFRRSNSFSFDQQTGTVYFVTPRGMLTAARGSDVRRIGPAERGWIGILDHGLLAFGSSGHLAIMRRDDGSLVASASWRGARKEIDSDIAVSDDGKVFAYRVASDLGWASVYFLRAGERQARMVYRHRFRQVGCGGYTTSVDFHGYSILYRSDAGGGPAEVALLEPDGSSTRLTRLLRALPRKSRSTPGNAYWASDFLE
jgi:hypothetical protein